MKTLVVLGILSLIMITYAKVFRFDYEFNEQAGGWLKFHVVPATWDEARRRCYAEGAVLASPLTTELKTAIVSFVKQHSKSDLSIVFSGVHATFSKGDYSSIEGVPLLRLPITWAPNEPDNYDNSESCLVMIINYNGTMADWRCSNVLPYVCYKKYTELTVTECGTTDHGYVLEPRTGSCYKFHERGLVWSEAYMTCVAEGGYLAIINSDEEAKVIRDIFAKHPEKNLFSRYRGSLAVGFHDWGSYGNSFMTIHGEPVVMYYLQWDENEPRNHNNTWILDAGEFCGGVLRDGNINYLRCNVSVPFICEMHPNSLITL